MQSEHASGFDIVGDIHGHADALEALLAGMGYSPRGRGWHHASRHLVFVGDLIDRGPKQVRAVEIARHMQDAGDASVCLGNHEFNAIAWMTPRNDGSGRYLRSRDKPAHQVQHHAFLNEVGQDSSLHRELVAWMRSLPVWLEFEGFRAVHACWHSDSMHALKPHLTPGNALTDAAWRIFNDRHSPAHVAAEILLKGIEARLPEGRSFLDKDGHERFEARVRWWSDDARTIRSAALCDDDLRMALPDDPLPADAVVRYDGLKPVFFGHYWLRAPAPVLESRDRACLDYSVAKQGHLVAYRWDGETVLDPRKFESVPAPR